MTGRERCTAAPTGELALPRDDVALETDEPSRPNPNPSVFAFDDTALFGRIEDTAGGVWITRDGFESIHRFGEGEFVVIEGREEAHAEFDHVAHG